MQVTVNSELGRHEHFQTACKQVRIRLHWLLDLHYVNLN